jgi:ribosomal protein S12 methylthiotransferase accessory factor YcaO
MTTENRESDILVSEQQYCYEGIVKSAALGQGTSEILPVPPMSLTQKLNRLDETPNDKWLWLTIKNVTVDDLPELVKRLKNKPSSAVLYAITPFLGQEAYAEVTAAVMNLDLNVVNQLLETIPTLNERTLILNQEHDAIESQWNEVRRRNREQLVPLSAMINTKMSIPKALLPSDNPRPTVPIYTIKAAHEMKSLLPLKPTSTETGTSIRDVNLASTIATVNDNPALEKLTQDQTLIGRSFCGTYSLEVPWIADWAVDQGRAHYRVQGKAGVSGKGLTKDALIASGLMELAERVSAIPGVFPNWPEGYKYIDCLRKATYSELKEEDTLVLDPNDFAPPTPYEDQAIYWFKAKILLNLNDGGGQPRDIWVPSQKAFHFSNLDEPQVVQETSNGLASGNTPEEACLHALLEIIERDGCYTMFTALDRIFTLPDDPNDPIGAIIEKYRAKGLHPAFIDLTSDFGVPTYKAFIQLPDGTILSGSGAHLNGRIALNRAICELGAKCTAISIGIGRLESKEQMVQQKEYSSLLNYSTGNVANDLTLVETLLRLNGFPVIYADLTRTDVNIPVVRAIVPGLDCPFILTKREVKHFLEDRSHRL